MIVLLACSINLSANDNQLPSTGELDEHNDSVFIAYDDLRLANSKLVELEHQKEINSKLKLIIQNDSITISEYSKINNRIRKDYDKAIRQRNIAISVGTISVITAIILIFK